MRVVTEMEFGKIITVFFKSCFVNTPTKYYCIKYENWKFQTHQVPTYTLTKPKI